MEIPSLIRKSYPSKITTSNYSLEEVVVLVEEYVELSDRRYKPWLMVRLLDLERNLPRLSRPYMEAVFLCGMAGLTTRTAGKLVGVSHTTMQTRYWRGVRQLLMKMNGVNN